MTLFVLWLAGLVLLLLPLWRLGAITQPNHGYYGLVLLLLGWGAWHLPGAWWLLAVPLAGAGLWLWGDDAYQHWRQLWQPGYESSVHRWFVRVLYPLPLVRRLTNWLDGLRG